MTRDFDAQLKRGQQGEALVAHLLAHDGWRTVRTADFTRPGAPVLYMPDGSKLVLPDIMAFKAGRIRWPEVKRKAGTTHHRNSGQFEHGFARRLRDQYLQIEYETSSPVWLFFYEDNTGVLLHGLLDELERDRREYAGDKMDRGGTVFYPRHNLTEWAYDGNLRQKFELPEPAANPSVGAVQEAELAARLESEWARERDWEWFLAQATAEDWSDDQ